MSDGDFDQEVGSKSGGRVPRPELVKAMLDAGGDYEVASVLLNGRMTPGSIQFAVEKDPKLRALYVNAEQRPPDQTEIDLRGPDEKAKVDRSAFSGLAQINLQLTLDAMREAGIKDTVLKKIEKLNKVNLSGAAFLATTLSSTHKLLHYEVLKLVEQLEFIDKQINDVNTPAKSKIQWMYLYANISEQVCKYHDRILTSTEALFRMSLKDKAKKPQKPGFSER